MKTMLKCIVTILVVFSVRKANQRCLKLSFLRQYMVVSRTWTIIYQCKIMVCIGNAWLFTDEGKDVVHNEKSYIGPVQSFVIHKIGCDEHLCKRVMTAHINIIFPFKAYIPSWTWSWRFVHD